MELILRALLCNYFLAGIVSTYTLTDEKNLRTSLLTGYDKELRPGTDRTFPLSVQAAFFLFSINEFDLNTGKLSLTGLFKISWIDERLSWNPVMYNQTNATSFKQNKVWIPNFININPYEDIKGLGSDLISVRVSSTGHCDWFAIQGLEVICDADVTKFPFDSQYCTMKFFIWGYLPHEIDVQFNSSEAFLTLYQENGIWDITDSTSHTQLNFYGYEEIVIGLQLKRRTSYYIVFLMLPKIALTSLLGFVFLLPPESGERVGLSTTVLLSIVLYLTLIQDMLPESSEPSVSLIGYMLVSYVVSGAISVICVIFSLRFQSSCQKPVPGFIMSFVKFCRKREKSLNTVEIFDSKSLEMDENEDSVTWTEVGRLFDKTCFVISLIQLALTSTIFFSLAIS
ncbi:neuronal acetylcholine receptor subunit alpha-7-like [Saccostrea echinata]|uniref:neuronal acetylcholine receptor subunit alpha-7-like n=1 Tax=Saccostrea echinata TaxID=191078 RepID=UPI002A82A25C|nr:neuronal acetylcholine receptor subunit alpha-7-like [Saccostrea echinata]